MSLPTGHIGILVICIGSVIQAFISLCRLIIGVAGPSTAVIMVEIPMRRHEEGGQPASSNELELGDSIASEGSPNPRALEHEHAEGSEDGPLNDSLNKGNANPPPVASADPFVRTRKPKSKKPKAMPRRPLR